MKSEGKTIAGQAQVNESWEAQVTEAWRVRNRIKNESWKWSRGQCIQCLMATLRILNLFYTKFNKIVLKSFIRGMI